MQNFQNQPRRKWTPHNALCLLRENAHCMNQSLQGFTMTPYLEASQTQKRGPLAHHAEQFFFQDELALLVFLAGLVRLVIFPPYRFSALSAGDVPHDMPPGRHATFDSLGLRYVDHAIEEVRFAMLATEVLREPKHRISPSNSSTCTCPRNRRETHPTDNIIVVSKMRFALLASKDFVGREVHVVCQTHYDLSSAFVPLPPVDGKSWNVSSPSPRHEQMIV